MAGRAVSYDGRGIFETTEEIYVLLGSGFRRTATCSEIASIPIGEVDVVRLEELAKPSPRSRLKILEDEDIAYCDVQMTHAQGTELRTLICKLRMSGDFPRLESVFRHIEQELQHR